DGLAARGIQLEGRMMLSDRAHVVLPWHVVEDQLLDHRTAAGEGIGSTLRGIGPCYRDKVGRHYAVRLGDMIRDDFREKIRCIVETKKTMLAAVRQADSPSIDLDHEAIYQEYRGYAERLQPFIADTTNYLLDAVEDGKRLLFEGAQGALLD